jgi:TRAP-type C4-dicarboxylate transport system substrate-binding protein
MQDRGMTIHSVDKTSFIQASEKAYDELDFKALRNQIWTEIGKK